VTCITGASAPGYNNYNNNTVCRVRVDSKRCSQLRADSIKRIYNRMNIMNNPYRATLEQKSLSPTQQQQPKPQQPHEQQAQRSLKLQKAECLVDRGVQALVKGRLDEAETQFTLAARLGEPAGLLTLGIEYELGRSWNRDLRKAQHLYMRCLSHYHSICMSKEEFEAKTVSVTSQLTQVNVKINRQECAVIEC
jgi:hypothetical protein